MSDNSAPYSKVLAAETYPASAGTIVLDVNEYHLLKSEISRLRSELEKAESVLAGMETNRNYWVRKCDQAIIERDEARRWANKLQERMFDALVKLYMSDHSVYYAVAELCDEVLDKSGALLGRVRDAARKGRANNV